MIVGVPKEIMDHENRVGLTPAGVEELVKRHGHRVLIQSGAGEGSGIGDDEYASAGAEIVQGPEEVYARAELIVKVKEPLPSEYGLLRKGHVLMTFLHLAALPELTRLLMREEIIAIAYETIQRADGSLPCLMPMSEVAGRMSVQIGAQYLEKVKGGRGVLLGGVPAFPRRRSSSSAPGLSAPTPPGSRWAWVLTSASSTSIRSACATLKTSYTVA